jgi:hypothetical protein
MSQASILQALVAHLDDFTPSMPVSAPNVTYTPTTGTPYLRVWHMPAVTDWLGLDPNENLNEHRGVLQIDVMWPAGQGVMQPLERADAIAAHFQRGQQFTHGGVTTQIVLPAEVARGDQDGAWFSIPVSVFYVALTSDE